MKYVDEPICDTRLSHIIHGCNAQGVMGAGVAKAIRDRWPGCFRMYTAGLTDMKDRLSMEGVLGSTIQAFVDGTDGRIVVHNLISQRFFGRDGAKYARYTDVVSGVVEVITYYPDAKQFAITKIGCSLGGLDWDVMSELLEELEEKYGVEFWVYTGGSSV